MATKAEKQQAEIAKAANDEREKKKAKMNLSSALNSALVVQAYSKSVFGQHQGSLSDVGDELSESIESMLEGDMKKCEGMLLAQAVALQLIFTSLSRRAIAQENLKPMDAFLRLGLKAQAQAVRTIEVLAEMKNPRSVAFVKQANIANNQQVNNGQLSRTGNFENQQSKLSEATNELFPDTRTQSIASGVDPALETVGKIDRTKVGGREIEGGSERV